MTFSYGFPKGSNHTSLNIFVVVVLNEVDLMLILIPQSIKIANAVDNKIKIQKCFNKLDLVDEI